MNERSASTRVAPEAAGSTSRIALVLSSFGLALASLGLGYSAYNACGFQALGIELLNCPAHPAVLPVRRNDGARLAALEAESEQLARSLTAIRERLRTATACPPGVDPPSVPPPQRAEPAPVPPPALKEDDWQQKRVDSLKGCWQLSSDYRLRDVSSGEITTVQSWRVCFDGEGRGEQTMRLSDGKTCTAPVKAGFPSSDSLELKDVDNVSCSGGTSVFRREINCRRQTSAEIDCASHQPETGSRSQVKLRRE